MSRLKILHKLLAVILLIGAIVGCCVWYAQSQMIKIDAAYTSFLGNEAKAIASIRRLNRGIYELSYWNYRLIAEQAPADIERANTGFQAAAASLTDVVAGLRKQAPSFTAAIDEQVEGLDRFVKAGSDVRILASANKNAEALAIAHSKVDPIVDTLVKSNIKLLNDIQIYVNNGSDRLIDQTNTTRYTLVGISTLGLLFGLVAGIFITIFGITRPLARLVNVLQRMAQGEIDADLPEARRGDEVGVVGRAVEGIKTMVAKKAAEEAERKQIADEASAAERRRTMVAMADGFEAAVGGIVGMVSSSATELQATAQTMTATATETAAQSTSVAAAAEEAGANVETVAAAAEELGASVSEIGRQVAGSTKLAQAAVVEADHTATLVEALSQTASRVGDVVELISQIARQTNLLALNATIEAARAGEAGRGFAVVAAEVKELANQTAKATDDIGQQIGQIQEATGQAVMAIGAIAARIREINDVSASIAAAVEEQGAATQEIVRNVGQAATGTGEVTSNIVGVAGAAEETGAAATQVLASASELSRQSEHLTAEVARFLHTVRAAA